MVSSPVLPSRSCCLGAVLWVWWHPVRASRDVIHRCWAQAAPGSCGRKDSPVTNICSQVVPSVLKDRLGQISQHLLGPDSRWGAGGCCWCFWEFVVDFCWGWLLFLGSPFVGRTGRKARFGLKSGFILASSSSYHSKKQKLIKNYQGMLFFLIHFCKVCSLWQVLSDLLVSSFTRVALLPQEEILYSLLCFATLFFHCGKSFQIPFTLQEMHVAG